MPLYSLKDKNTGEIFDKVMKISEYTQYVLDNPHIERYYESASSNITIGDPVRLMDGIKPPSDFMKGVVGRIADSVPGSTINQGRKFQIPREW